MTGFRGPISLLIIVVTIGFAGSIDITIDKYPWQAALFIRYPVPLHSATIISQEHVLTNADLVSRYAENNELKHLSIDVGKTRVTSKKGEYKVEAIIIHPNYNNSYGSPWNLAVLKLTKKIVFNEFIKPVELPTEKISPGTVVYLSGWETRGYDETIASQLVAHRSIINSDACPTSIKFDKVILELGNDTICTKESFKIDKECLEDRGIRGSPLVHGNVLVGIKTWSLDCVREEITHEVIWRDYPMGFTDISIYADWIEELIENC